MMRFKTNQLLLAVCLSAVCNGVWAQINSNKLAVNSINGDHVVATVNFPAPITGDLYVAAKVNGNLFFIGQGATLSTTPLAFLSNTLFTNDITVLDIPSTGIPSGNYLLYQVVTMPGTDPTNVNNWIGGFSGLSYITFSINLANTVKSVVTPPPTPVLNGADVYNSNCGSCHYAGSLVGLSASGINYAIRNVRRMNYISLSAAQMTAIAGYLATQ